MIATMYLWIIMDTDIIIVYNAVQLYFCVEYSYTV